MTDLRRGILIGLALSFPLWLGILELVKWAKS